MKRFDCHLWPYFLLGWCISNCDFALLNFAVWYWTIFLNKCGYVVHHFNVHFYFFDSDLFSSVSLSHVQLFATPWTTACQASLSITNSQSLPKPMSIESVMPSNHLLSSPSPPALNLSQHQGLFQWVSSSHQVAKVLEFQLHHQSFQWTPRTDLL